MQNKPKVKIGKMNITSFITMAYENKYDWTLGKRGKNKAKQTQFQSQKNAQVRISHYFKQFEKRLVTERLSGDYLESREKDKRNKSFSFS